MQPFTAQDHAVIADAISRAERQTSGEIVVVVARASSRYRYFSLMCVALLALVVPLPLIHFTKWPIEYVYLLQLGVFGLGALLMQWELLRIAITPASVKRTRAHQRAVEQFLVQNLHTTKGRTGVLIYVSDAERYAEVIADDGIYQKVTPQVWDALIAALTANIRSGNRTEGFVAAIETCGAILAEHFPPEAFDHDELPNHLIVLDAAEPA
ncbi:MAG TPA: TPM domain-containing protein [Methyloceanibacter sp.]|nr:TPM domain-containing protein [Methyloceanibacter sp.]